MHRISVAELTLDNSERVLQLGAHECFVGFDITRLAISVVADLGKTAGIIIYHFLIFTKQCCTLCDIMGIRRRDRDGMYGSAASVHAGAAYHPGFPLTAFSPSAFPEIFAALPFTSHVLWRYYIIFGTNMVV